MKKYTTQAECGKFPAILLHFDGKVLRHDANKHIKVEQLVEHGFNLEQAARVVYELFEQFEGIS